MKKITDKEKLSIFKRMLELAISDKKQTAKSDKELYGLCMLLYFVDCDYYISYFPELMRHKPKNAYPYWFHTNSKGRGSMKRINILKVEVKKLETKLNQDK